MKRLFAAVLIISGALLVVVIVAISLVAAPDPGPRGDRNPSVVLYWALGAVLAIFGTSLALLLLAVGIAGRLKSIRASNPGAPVVVVQRLRHLAEELGSVTGHPIGNLPSYLIVGAGRREVAFWGRDVSRPLAVISRDDIDTVTVEEVYHGRPLPAIALHVETTHGLRRITIVPCREGWEIAAVVERSRTVEIARQFESVT